MNTNKILNANLIYDWELTNILVVDKESTQNIITKIYWTLTGTDVNNNSGVFIGITPLEESDVNTFIQFNNVTQKNIIGWVEDKILSSGIYVQHINDFIAKQISEKLNPTSILSQESFPWMTAIS